MCGCQKGIGQDKWQEYIRRGDTEFSLKYFGNAILMYHQALSDARFRYKSMARQSHDHAISRVVISYFNLANCYIKLDQIVRASDCYSEAQGFLLQACDLEEITSTDLQQAIIHAGAHIDSTWLGFLRQFRDQISYERITQYHEASLLLKNLPCNVVLH